MVRQTDYTQPTASLNILSLNFSQNRRAKTDDTKSKSCEENSLQLFDCLF
jgi:hypothetical protein